MRGHQLRQFVFITLLSLCLQGSVNARPADKPAEKNEIEQALTDIGSGSAADLKSRLFTNRLTVIDAAFRARAIDALPAALRDQRLTQGDELQRAEKNLQRVLALHKRPESSAVEIFLLRDETARVMLWRGCVLVLSAGLVNALSDAELSGIIAHELGHSYFMDEMAVAQRARDSRTMKTVELKCDAVAILSLKLLGHDPALYLIGLRKQNAIIYRKGSSSGSIYQTHPEYLAAGERSVSLKGSAMLMRATLMLSLLLGLTVGSAGQTRPMNLKPGSVEARTLAFFEQIEDRSFEDYLRRVRLPKVSAAFKAEVLARVAKGEEIKVSEGMKGKLAALEPILRYHERDSVIEIRMVSAREAFVGLQGRAVLLISEAALNLLPAAELQAVVAHELGHEYFWGELMEARQRKERAAMREIEMRCGGIAVITLRSLRLDPAKLVSALTTLRMFNARTVSTDLLFHPLPDERSRFIRAMDELVKSKSAPPVFALTGASK